MPGSDARRELINAAFRLKAEGFEKCLGPDPSCGRRAIRAHAVQNSRVLDLLARDGHVVVPTHRMEVDRGIVVDLTQVSRYRATTFTGLCEEHDRDLFAPIERAPIDLADVQHLFLLAYRAALFEAHATGAAGRMLQLGYQKRVALGVDPKDAPSPAGIYATERLMVAYETFMYKCRFDQAYLASDWSAVQHDTIIMNTARPALAASAMFSLRGLANAAGDVVRVCLTVLPLDAETTAAVVSYLPEDAGIARAHLDRLIASGGEHQKYELSRHLLNYCANFALAPDHIDTWTPEKKEIVRGYFVRTILQDDLDYEHPDLLLL